MAFRNITVHEAREQQAAGYTYVDVRSIPEFAQGHPAGAVNVPLLHRDEHSAHPDRRRKHEAFLPGSGRDVERHDRNEAK